MPVRVKKTRQNKTSADELRHQFDMRGMAELVDRPHAFDPVTAVDQNPRVARKRRGIARHCDHHANFAGRARLRFLPRAPARAIEYDRILSAPFLPPFGTSEE